MPKRLAVNALNASTLQILNVIRENASYQYQKSVPKIEQATDIPTVGEVIYGTPAFANEFINALVNRIALVKVNSATFNNPYNHLKKGYLNYGETVEDIFVQIADVFEFSAEKAESRELKRYLPKVKAAFYKMNWRVVYPVTIQDDDLQTAFLSMEGVQNMIARIVEQVYTAYEYDEFLLFKYMLIKAISKGKLYPVNIGTGEVMTEAAEKYRGFSNLLPFMSPDYNEAHVRNTTPKGRQAIFMDAMYNAAYDVNVLASAFNMSKAEYEGRLHLIDNWTSFDNERFEVIRENSTGVEAVTPEELALLANVKAVLIDTDWFQVYDNKNKFTEKYVASGLYWNYFYHSWKTIAHSPYSNAIVFVTSDANIALPATITVNVISKDETDEAIVLGVAAQESTSLAPSAVNYVQTEGATAAGVGIVPYGGILIPISQKATALTLEAEILGAPYKAGSSINGAAAKVGDSITFSKVTSSVASAALNLH